MFIVVEGLDGVGKSTFTKALANKIGAVPLHTPSDKFTEARKIFDNENSCTVLARQLFYASTVIDLSAEIRTTLAKGNSVVVDRYWLSTQVYHDWKSQGTSFKLTELCTYLVAPDFTIYLELELDKRQHRLTSRKSNTAEDRKTLNHDDNATLNKLYANYRDTPIVGRWLTVDATSDVDSIVSSALKKMETMPARTLLI